MNSKAERSGGAADTLKLGAAVAVMLAGMVGFYYYDDQVTWMRVLGLLVAAGIGVWIAAQSVQGRALLGFLQAANVELRKVVWPSRQETVQTTLIVLVVVILVGIMLWLIDMFFGWAIRGLIGA
jgi:preprotein translocase subunit SecE